MNNVYKNMPPLVLLHGFMGSTLAHFGKVVKFWYNMGKPILAYDFPGHGACLKNASVNYYEDAIDYILNKLEKYERVDLLGVSYLGGTIALKIAQQKTELINKVIISGFTYDIPKTSFCAWSNNFKELVKEHPTLALEYDKLHGNRWEKTMNLVIDNISESYNSSICITADVLKILSIPTLLINGDYKDNERRAVEDFPYLSGHFSAAIIAGAGHIVPYDRPVEFCNYVDIFLGEKADD